MGILPKWATLEPKQPKRRFSPSRHTMVGTYQEKLRKFVEKYINLS
jgi:hypothetical protein